MNTSLKIALAAALSSAMLAGCATTAGGSAYGSAGTTDQEGMSRTKKGALIGAAVAGAALAYTALKLSEKKQKLPEAATRARPSDSTMARAETAGSE